MFPRTVRARATVAASLIVAATLAVSAVALLLVLEKSLRDGLDRTLTARAQDLAAVATGLPVGAQPHPGGAEHIALIVDASGHIVAASPDEFSEASPPFAPFPVPPAEAPDDAPHLSTVEGRDEDGEPEIYRVAARTTDDGRLTVYAAGAMERVTEPVGTVRLALIVGLPPLLALLSFVTWLVVGRSLRPVEAIRAEVADISEHELDRRVPVPETDDEIGRLARTMNAMLARLERAGERQRAFVADASHELQSPLASFRTQLEVALAHPDATDWRATARGLLDADRAMERLVRDLLFLAREDEAGGHTPWGPDGLAGAPLLDLDVVVLEEAARLRAATDIRVDASGVSAAPLRGSRDNLARLVRNLLENAERHAAAEVTVTLALTADGAAAVLTVGDDGPGIPEEFRPHVFERFRQADTARTRGAAPGPPGARPPRARGGGAGLGLAIAKTIVENHGGTITTGDRADGLTGARFTVRLPSSAPPR